MVTNKKGYMRKYRQEHPAYVQKSKEQIKEYRKKYPDKAKHYFKETYKHIKITVLSRYSKGQPHCANCGETELRKLNLDHINEDGREHRKTITGLKQLYLWVRRNNYPETFQVLCHRCNILKYHASKRKFGGKLDG